MVIPASWYNLRFETDEAVAITGATRPQIEHLVRSELVVAAQPASRRGVSRQYDLHNLIEIAVASELFERGLPPRDTLAALLKLRDQWARVLRNKYSEDEGPAEILIVYRKPLSSIGGPSAQLNIEIVAVRKQLLLIAKDLVIEKSLPLEAIVRNIISKVAAYEQWKASRPK